MKKKTVLILFLLFSLIFLFFVMPILTHSLFFPWKSVEINNVEEYTKSLDFGYNPDGLIYQKYGVRNISKRVKSEKYIYALQNYDISNDIVYNSLLDKYFVKEDFSFPELPYDDIEYLKLSKVIAPEIRTKYYFFKYEYDALLDISTQESDFMLGIIKGENKGAVPVDISTEDFSEYFFIRAYPKSKQFFYNIGIAIEFEGELYFSEGIINEKNECINCYEIPKE